MPYKKYPNDYIAKDAIHEHVTQFHCDHKLEDWSDMVSPIIYWILLYSISN